MAEAWGLGKGVGVQGKALGFGESPAIWGMEDGVHCQLTTALRGPASLFEGQVMEEEKASQQQ